MDVSECKQNTFLTWLVCWIWSLIRKFLKEWQLVLSRSKFGHYLAFWECGYAYTIVKQFDWNLDSKSMLYRWMMNLQCYLAACIHVYMCVVISFHLEGFDCFNNMENIHQKIALWCCVEDMVVFTLW